MSERVTQILNIVAVAINERMEGVGEKRRGEKRKERRERERKKEKESEREREREREPHIQMTEEG